jgi:hypothetical protein
VATLESVKAITTTTSLPGQIGGPSIELVVRIVNGSSHAISVGNVVVNMCDSANDPAIQITTKPAKAFRGVIASGSRATGIYVFSIPTARRNPITVELNYAAGTPVATFTGSVR